MRLFLVKEFLDLIFPRNCTLCRRSLFDSEECLCSICIGLLPITSYHLRAANNDLVDKVKGLTEAGKVMSYLKFTKKGDSQKLLHHLKYQNNPQLARLLGKLYGTILNGQEYARNWEAIVPVPLHPVKLRRRGYNQSEEFGVGLSQVLNIPLNLMLERTLFTSTQTNKTRLERLENVEDVFQYSADSAVYGKSILLIDDVMTTGATLCACGNVLLRNGAKNVDLATIAAGG